MTKISAVVNTLNEEKKIERCLSSLKGFAHEIVVVDMMSTDKTREIAKRFGAKIYKHKRLGYVEPARNFAIEKAKYDWVFVIDADEEIKNDLKTYIKKELKDPRASFYRIPRKNMIFGKWMKHSGWWPDYNIRLFKKGSVSWNEVIHSVPMTLGRGFDIPSLENLAIVHRHYQSIEEYLLRMNRYTTIQARDLNKKGIEFKWRMLLTKPLSEFLRRYFAEDGYKDGLHGLSLSVLQAFSEAILYLKLWQKQRFYKKKIPLGLVLKEKQKIDREIKWWFLTSSLSERKPIVERIWLRIQRKFLS